MMQQCPKNRCSIKMSCILTKRVQNSLLGILLVRFCPHFKIQTFFLAFFVHRMQKIEKIIKNCGLFFVDFLLILYQKLTNYCCSPKRHPLATINAMRINVSALKRQFRNLFWTLFYDPDHCARVGVIFKECFKLGLVISSYSVITNYFTRVFQYFSILCLLIFRKKS